jgi:hypothetical protein
MNVAVDGILANLRLVGNERALRLADPGLDVRVAGLKGHQQRRFSRTYADLLSSVRYGAAARFFLDELYGPADFTNRDAQFARVVPSLVRMVPHEVVETVKVLSELHALTETLDTAMAGNASTNDWTPATYVRAWQKTGRRADRDLQISSTLVLATRLDAMTRNALLRKSLRLMRTPARLSGLQDLQRFLEAGFDAFGAMGGAADFIQLIETRERDFIASQFAGRPLGA